MLHMALQILVDGFAISAIYALGAVGFTIIFGVSGVLNLCHGAVMVVGAIVAWYMATHLGVGVYLGSLIGIAASVVVSYLLFWLVIRPIERSRRIPGEEKEIFILTTTLLVGIIIQGVLNYIFGSNPVATPPISSGVQHFFGVTVTNNELIIDLIAWAVLVGMWLFINRTRFGKALLAASMSKMGLALMGYEIRRVNNILWGLYGVLAGFAGVLLASFLGANAEIAASLTASAFAIVVLGGLGSVPGSLVAAYIIGYVDTATAYVVSPAFTELPGLLILVLILYVRPQGLFGRL